MKREKRPNAMTYLDCNACRSDDPAQPNRLSPEARASWRCGWIPEHERRAPGFRGSPPNWDHKPTDLCPGYLISLPQVMEAANAHSWCKDMHQPIDRLYAGADPDPEALLHVSILVLNQALGEAESEAMAKVTGG